MASVIRVINSLLPFTTPGTPLWQDVAHALILCTVLNFAVQAPWHRAPDVFRRITRRTNEAADGLVPEGGEAEDTNQHGVLEDEEVEDEAEEVDDGDREQHAHRGHHNLDPATALGFDGDNNNDNAGPAQPHHPQPRDPNRAVGAKKAKALARRDRVRAYNEFLRSQGDAQRAQDAEGAEEREKEARAERERRMKVEKRLEEQRIRERQARKQKEEERIKAEEKDKRQIQKVVQALINGVVGNRKAVDLKAMASEMQRPLEWIVDVLRRDGMVGVGNPTREGGTKRLTMITNSGWFVVIDDRLMRRVYEAAARQAEEDIDNGGKVGWADLQRHLVDELAAGS